MPRTEPANEGRGRGLHVCLDPPLNLASTNGARSWTKAEHVGRAQNFPPQLWAAATPLCGRVCGSCSALTAALVPGHFCPRRAAGRKVSKQRFWPSLSDAEPGAPASLPGQRRGPWRHSPPPCSSRLGVGVGRGEAQVADDDQNLRVLRSCVGRGPSCLIAMTDLGLNQ